LTKAHKNLKQDAKTKFEKSVIESKRIAIGNKEIIKEELFNLTFYTSDRYYCWIMRHDIGIMN